MTTAPTCADAAIDDLVRLLRDPRRIPPCGQVALRIGVGLIRWTRRLADGAEASDRVARIDAAGAARRARDRAFATRFLSGPR